MKRALTIADMMKMKDETFPFEGAWKEMLGNPDTTGAWFIWGGSGSGKTSFALRLAKELARYRKVAYDSIEQGASLSMRQNLQRVGMAEVSRNFILIPGENIRELSLRLSKRKSPDVVVVDSFQTAHIKYSEFTRLLALCRKKLLIFVSKAKGSQPMGDSAINAMYDADLKIYVEGQVAVSKGRYIGSSGRYVIWEERALEYWGDINNINKKKDNE